MTAAIVIAACLVAAVFAAAGYGYAVWSGRLPRHRLARWLRNRRSDPRRHQGDFWLWSKEDPREVDHE